ncbi:MAG TPA: bifunctional UDP-N-acetylglucosamine diphosphorylase/glucosamine-1-phosphate N-acetyltransferase GlmU [Candidatus Nanopelagicaceae bacterium]|nr:bifunctional UDP-N-acetylglucosamine diphosphorylase/glucosamine-1-phosphate N-acetyltransferase GlmU [Candidatus Nanopelagicaceae bacterium]
MSQLDLAIVLAAGEGTRMKSTRAKVLHEIAGRSLLDHVLHAIAPLQAKEVRVVVGASKDEVIAHLKEVSPASRTVLQEVRGGTGHAVKLALENYSGSGSVLVCAGDTPLLTSETLTNLFNAHNSSKASATVLTTEMPDPSGYGRVIRDNDGNLAEIVEERDATESQKQTLEINSGVYIFDLDELRVALSHLSASNSQKEEYLTDVIAILKKSGKKVGAFASHDFTEILGINDRAQLSTSSFIMNARICDALMRSGVTIVDPMSTWIDMTAEIDIDVRIEPGTAIKGKCKIGKSAVIGPRTTLIHCNVGSNAHILESHCDSSAIGANAVVGPYSHLRSGTVLAGNVKVGSFVEIKNSTVGESSKVPHLSYVGDATIGTESNIGAATVIVNYDGVEKHQTTIGDHVRIGSDSMLVAPVTIGDGAYTAAGSVITEDVPPGALGMGRAKQTNILGWVLKKRKGTKSAEAAAKKEGSK